MPHLTPRRALIVVAVLLVAATQAPRPVTQRVHNLPRNVVETATGPVSAVLRRVSLMVRPGDHRGADFGPIDTQLEDYANAVVYSRRLEEELERLREKLEFYEQTAEVLGGVTRRFVDARVTRSITDAQQPRLVIAEGRGAGLEPGQAVVSGVHLVGQVSDDLGPLTARIELLMRPGAEMQARIRPPLTDPQTRDFKETLTVTDDGTRLTCEVWIEQPVEVGDLAHLADPLWPDDALGFLLGQVVEIDDRVERPLEFKRLVIEPGVEAQRLRRVTVLVEDRGGSP